MLEIRSGTVANIYDVDDTLVGRQRLVRAGSALKTKVKSFKHNEPIPSLDDIPLLSHDVVDAPVTSFLERKSLQFHAARQVYPEARKKLAGDFAQGVHNYANTGRANKKEWADMTDAVFEAGGIKPFIQEVIYTPHGVRTHISKVDGIRIIRPHYELVNFYEDDEYTAKFASMVYPDLNVFLITYGRRGIVTDAREMEQFPNMRRIAFVGDER